MAASNHNHTRVRGGGRRCWMRSMVGGDLNMRGINSYPYADDCLKLNPGARACDAKVTYALRGTGSGVRQPMQPDLC